MKIIQSALKFRQVTLSVLLLIFAVGVYSLLTMPRREDPKITIRSGLVVAYYPGANSLEVENQVTKKVEEYLFQYKEVVKNKTISTSRDGFMSIMVELNEKVMEPDIFWSNLRHQMLVTKQIDLPKGVVGPIINSDFGDTEAMVLAVESDKATYAELVEYTKRIESNIRKVPSVSKMKRIGEQKEQFTIKIDQDKLIQYGINVEDLVKIIQSQNTLLPAGKIESNDLAIPITTIGNYKTMQDLGTQLIGMSKTGEVVHLNDIATIVREQVESQTEAYVNGRKTILLSIQMQEGNNIVQFGDEVEAAIAQTQKMLPSYVEINSIVNQPYLVDHSISHFIKEFFIAIVAVIFVVMLMLPLNVAAVAATAIPVTVAITFAVMNLLGIELHQVSLAALIVVLGMVVDDAIVIADNYVEKLDEGFSRWDAAWKSASELFVPVLSATITIIAAFIPMLLLKGSMGEFISALPLTVAIALSCSFIVAVLLTPFLCYVFIKKGLHVEGATKTSLKNRMLDGMQNSYNKILDRAVKFPKTTLVISFATIIIAGVLFKTGVKQKFFPSAERNQFAIEVWLPTGSDLKATKQAVQRIENVLKTEKRIENFTSFIGTSAPRFYYNHTPELPTSNFGQVLVNTDNDQSALILKAKYSEELGKVAPEARVDVKLMQQGQPMGAPVEIRIVGNQIETLKSIEEEVQQIVAKSGNFVSVKSDYNEDYLRVNVVLKDEAKRLGFTTESISKTLYTASNGALITTIYEGDIALQVKLKLSTKENINFDDLSSMYLTSPITKASIPLSQLASLEPTWYPGRIIHRNGTRTMTVLCEPLPDMLPSVALASIKKEIENLDLPAGYTTDFGGEYANQKETFGEMIFVLMISILLIFFILLFQFKNLRETIVVMLTIPLSLFGAIFGLYITGNNFGFTAFIGLISLSGIVVRNAIILVDYARELRFKHGYSIRDAAIESGKRRLRPIFLTAMAAAIGVIPMIASGSQMWSPLASIIAMGVIWSMVMALLTVPIMYMMWVKPEKTIEK